MGRAKKEKVGKPPVHLLPPNVLLAVAEILAFGAEKYGEHNWRKGVPWSEIYAAAQRHQLKFWAGADLDEESKKHHLAHGICDLMFLLTYVQEGTGEDDRFHKFKPKGQE